MSKNRRPTGRGLTLLEIIVAIVIISVVLALSAQVYISMKRSQRGSQEYLQAVLLAEEVMAQDIPRLLPREAFTRKKHVTQRDTEYYWSADISPLQPGLSKIELTVTWTGVDGVHSHAFHTMRRQVGQETGDRE